MEHKIDIYDDYAIKYAERVAAREEAGIEHEPDGIMPHFLSIIGDVSGLVVLDAGCGEGYLSRILVERGAKVTGIDIAPNLIQIARIKEAADKITYQIADLSQPLAVYEQYFDLIVSHLVLNDVFDYRGFLFTLASVAKRGGRLVLSMNNPYSYVVRNHVTNYFDSGKAFFYGGMSKEGVKVHFYQRTLEEYLDAALTAGFQLQRLVDVPTLESILNKPTDKWLPRGYQFPYFMILNFMKS